MKKHQGLTLVELIIAIAILTIIVLAFLNALSGGFINIISNGNKTRALSEAQSIIDYMDAKGTDVESTLVGAFPKIKAKVDIANLLSSPYDSSKPIYYAVEDVTVDSLTLDKVTVIVYYQNGSRYVTLSAMLDVN